jgi:hypothetical protein
LRQSQQSHHQPKSFHRIIVAEHVKKRRNTTGVVRVIAPAIKQEAAIMSIAKKAGLLIGVIGAVATVAATAEGGEGGHGKRFRGSPVFIVEQPVVVRQAPVYVAPAPVIYAPAPTYYEPMYPSYDRYPSSPSLNINIPLR